MIAHEGEPETEQAVRALLDRADDGARALARMIADGQRDRLIEGRRHGNEAAPVRQPVGGQRDDHPCENAEKAERGPEPDEREGARALRECVDDAAEQNGLGKQNNADCDVGGDQAAGEPALRRQQAERPAIGRDDAHAWQSCRRLLSPRLALHVVCRLDGLAHAGSRFGREVLLLRYRCARRSWKVNHANTPGMNHGVPL